MSLEQDVLEKIKPSPERRMEILQKVEDLLARTKAEIDKKDLGMDTMLVGSVAKDTFLNEPDVDIFLLFPEPVTRATLEAVGLEVGKQLLEGGKEHYAEHPYIRGIWKGLDVDMVPCYDIKDTTTLMSAVDRTPFHTRYIKAHLREEQKDQVRLLKQFAKGIGVYGAEAKTQGLSGYLMELLILRYGSFRGVLEAAAQWSRGVVLGLTDQGQKGFPEPLTFYDPVDGKRNVASALSAQSMAVFILAARAYLKEPSERFFFPRKRAELSAAEITERFEERRTGALVVVIDRPDLIDDNLYPQVRRTMDGITALLESSDFRIVDRSVEVSDSLYFAFELEALTLSLAKRHSGPPVWIGNAASFLERWDREGLGRPFVENGHWTVIAPREQTTAAGLVRSKLATAALGSALRDLKGLDVSSGPDAVNEKNRAVLTSLLDKRMRWEI